MYIVVAPSEPTAGEKIGDFTSYESQAREDGTTVKLALPSSPEDVIILDGAVATGAGHSVERIYDASAVNGAGNEIDLGYEHGFATGDAIVYSSNGGAAFSGLDLLNLALSGRSSHMMVTLRKPTDS